LPRFKKLLNLQVLNKKLVKYQPVNFRREKYFMNRLLLLTALCCLFLSHLAAQNAFISDSLDAYVNREMQRWQVPGLAISVVKDGKVVLSKGYGYTNLESKKPVNEFTLFQIASNSKAFTGTAIALLNYEKKLGLDEPVSKYMPWFKLYEPSSTQLCTVKDLLTHRVGLGTFQGDFLNWGSTLSRKEIIEGMARTKPLHPFRYTYGYCNAGYITAGELIPLVDGRSWDNYLEQVFFKPLGMTHTHTSYELMKNDANACTPYTLYYGKLKSMPLTNIDNMGPSASINSCVADMAKWLQLQLDSGKWNGQQLIPFKVIQETRKSHMVSGDIQSRLFPSKHFSTYGLGWNSYDYNGKRIWEHSGGANGFVTKTEYIPEMCLGVIVYTNSDANSLYDALVKQVIESYMGLPYRNISETYYNRSLPGMKSENMEMDSLLGLVKSKPKPPIPLTYFEGNYTNELYGGMQIIEEKGKLSMHLSHHPNNIGALQYIGNNQFLCTYSDITCGIQVLKFDMEGGTIKTLHVKVNDFIDYQTYPFEKEIVMIEIKKK
jgi:CubicO group peptidase (beta-lactamase class C family)